MRIAMCKIAVNSVLSVERCNCLEDSFIMKIQYVDSWVHFTVVAILECIRANQLRFTSNEYLATQATQANALP